MARSARISFVGSTCFRWRCPRCGNAGKTLCCWWSTSSIATRQSGKTIRRVSKRTLDLLKSYPWPGNVRELQNVIERSVILSDTDEFTVDESWLSTKPAFDSRRGMSGALASHEKSLIEDALRATGGRVFGSSGAAARLGMPRSTLESKIRALKIKKSRFRTQTPKNS